jgi:hypothetical protein
VLKGWHRLRPYRELGEELASSGARQLITHGNLPAWSGVEHAQSFLNASLTFSPALLEVAVGLIDLAFTFHLRVISRVAQFLFGCALSLVLLVFSLSVQPIVGLSSCRGRHWQLRASGAIVHNRRRSEESVTMVRSPSVVVLATADSATHRAQHPQGRANHQQDDADGLQDGYGRDKSHNREHNSEDDHLRFPSSFSCTGSVHAWNTLR